MKIRCSWANGNDLLENYHDQEWGVPVHDDRLLFEFLILEGAQAGLSWMLILQKRNNYREAFDNFQINKVAHYNKDKIEELLENPGIIRNRLKIKSTVSNAQAVLDIQKEYGSFDSYIWKFVDHNPIQNKWKALDQIPSSTSESEKMSKDLKKRGFKFVGPTICYGFIQAVGMVNDHLVDCFRHSELEMI
ncbi:MAG: DNA-3-methyladenine glycosylase I [Methanobacterium sp.]|nr:DNA-3-methyladenine glycosylase I [Methanobacterium sp.]